MISNYQHQLDVILRANHQAKPDEAAAGALATGENTRRVLNKCSSLILGS
ncbi:hypothetical protein SAMN02745225_02256 [Ferrithrix thermotolerans DSM 19514]|uniref:Uncharacterized protein n=1 Tax=Ferrithrix thermotolerans DSM 19514 TaxID=1121881 RepID=A0A1M4Y6T9_9ACTN|nr:hypothetical protein SAMN02745225_02256 [Ferrithrix thermotolerans DSM 19514]